MFETCLRVFFHVPELIASYYPLGPSVSKAKIKVSQREYSVVMEYNNQGFRDREFSFLKDDTKRILFLGDSFVEGQGVPWGLRASDLLEKKLNEQNAGKYRVINAGQGATNPISYFDNFIRFGVALKPEIVVVGIFMGNDFMGSRSYPVPKDYEVKEVLDQSNKKVGSFLNLGFLHALAGQIITHEKKIVRNIYTDNLWEFYYKEKMGYSWFLNKSGLSKEELDKRLKKLDPSVVSDFMNANINPGYLLNAITSMGNVKQEGLFYNDDDLNNVFALVSEINRIAKKRDIKLIVIVYPDEYQVMPDKFSSYLINVLHMPELPIQLLELKDLRTRFISLLSKDNITYIDDTDKLTASDYHLFDGHLNAHGNAVIADDLFNFLKRDGR